MAYVMPGHWVILLSFSPQVCPFSSPRAPFPIPLVDLWVEMQRHVEEEVLDILRGSGINLPKIPNTVPDRIRVPMSTSS